MERLSLISTGDLDLTDDSRPKKSGKMTTTYHPRHVGPYHNQLLPLYPSTLAQVRCPVPSTTEGAVRGSQYSGYLQPQTFACSQPRDLAAVATQKPISSLDNASHPLTPATETSMNSESAGPTSDKGLVHHSLQLPACISPKGGNLADFTAEVGYALLLALCGERQSKDGPGEANLVDR